MERCFSNQTRY